MSEVIDIVNSCDNTDEPDKIKHSEKTGSDAGLLSWTVLVNVPFCMV